MKLPLLRLATLLAALLAACSDQQAAPGPAGETPAAPAVAFDTARVLVPTDGDTLVLRVEVAADDVQRAMGLMERTTLAPDAGMLFTYTGEQPPDAGYWMFRVHFPIEIAYLDADGRIVAIEQMEPCTSPDPQWCPTYPPGVSYSAALEVNPGFLARHGLGIGDRLILP